VSDGILTILKFCLMALVYLFLARVVAIVGAELKGSPPWSSSVRPLRVSRSAPGAAGLCA